MTTGLTKIEDLLNQDRYQWGTVKDTHPEVALSNSVREDFKDIIRKQVSQCCKDEHLQPPRSVTLICHLVLVLTTWAPLRPTAAVTITTIQDAVLTTDEGFERVLNHDYAFIYESPIFEYMKRQHCSLETVGTGEFLSFE